VLQRQRRPLVRQFRDRPVGVTFTFCAGDLHEALAFRRGRFARRFEPGRLTIA
jgi:hypothetical protein